MVSLTIFGHLLVGGSQVFVDFGVKSQQKKCWSRYGQPENFTLLCRLRRSSASNSRKKIAFQL